MIGFFSPSRVQWDWSYIKDNVSLCNSLLPYHIRMIWFYIILFTVWAILLTCHCSRDSEEYSWHVVEFVGVSKFSKVVWGELWSIVISDNLWNAMPCGYWLRLRDDCCWRSPGKFKHQGNVRSNQLLVGIGFSLPWASLFRPFAMDNQVVVWQWGIVGPFLHTLSPVAESVGSLLLQL